MPDAATDTDVAPATTASTIQDAESIFKETCASFRENLPDFDKGEFREFENAGVMISELQSLAESHPVHKAKLTVLVRKLHTFTSKVEPYFEIITIFAQIKADVSSAVWGSLRVLFKLLSNYVTYLDSVADMFGQLSDTLPIYGDFVTRLQARAFKRGETYPRLVKVMAYLYRDILGFCHDMCIMFSKKRQGFRARVSLVGRLSGLPIRAQFSSLLSNIEDHKRILELEISRASTEEALRFYNCMEANLLEHNKPPEPSSSNEREPEIIRSLKQLWNWIDPPEFYESLESAQDKRTTDTCQWIVGDPTFQRWQSNVGDQKAGLDMKTLLFQAKPGFGKTILCSRAIEELGTYTLDEDDTAQDFLASVLFYFFDQRRGQANGAYDALRAIAAQIISLHRYTDTILRTAMRSMDRDRNRHTRARDKKILELLNELLPLSGPVFIVIDGLDECNDIDALFATLKEIDSRLVKTRKTRNYGWFLCGRPSVIIPPWLHNGCHRLEPNHPINVDDIRLFLRPEVQDLVDSGLLPDDIPTQGLVEHILPRANGMFLWARLLMEYLRSPALSIRDRKEAMLHLNRLEGLDALYKVILKVLSKNPKCSTDKIRNIFRWIVVACEPLTVEKLRVAVSIDPGRCHSKEDEIPNFSENLGALTGSLIEFSPQGMPQFIHLSTREFFQNQAMDSGEQDSETDMNFSGSNLYVSTVCLSYLFHTVPAEPLSGSAQEIASIGAVKSRYPLLDYVSAYWAVHFARAAEQLSPSSLELLSDDLGTLTQLVTRFINDRRSVTTWIEAAWLFGKPNVPDPRLQSRSLSKFPTSGNLSLGPSMHAIELVYELSKDIETLKQEWSHVLANQPNEIWEPSVPTFTKSRFWISTREARLIPLARDNGESRNCITIQSQISESGLEMALIRLLTPDEWSMSGSLSWLQSNPTSRPNWKGRFELWSLHSNKLVCAFELMLPPEKILPLVSDRDIGDIGDTDMTLPRRLRRETRPRDIQPTISLPAAISPDVRRVVILDTVLQVIFDDASSNSQAAKADVKYDVLSISQASYTSVYQRFRDDINIAATEFNDFFTLKFSPSGKYLAVIRESCTAANKGGNSYGELWLMQIFQDMNFESSQSPRYQSIVSSIFFAVPEIAILGPSRGVSFHPTLPRIAFPQVFEGLPATYLWDFEQPVSAPRDRVPGVRLNPLPLHDPPIFDPYFSDEGDYLCGTDTPLEYGFNEQAEHQLCIPIATHVPNVLLLPGSSSRSSGSLSALKQRYLSRSTATALAERPKPNVLHANTLIFEKDAESVVHVSQLQQLEKEGAVMMRTFGTDGTFKSETLSRLPKSIKDCVNVSIVHSTPADARIQLDPSKVYVVMNKSHQKFYTRHDLDDRTLPAVLEREKDSIPTFLSTVNMAKGVAKGFEMYHGVQRLEWR